MALTTVCYLVPDLQTRRGNAATAHRIAGLIRAAGWSAVLRDMNDPSPLPAGIDVLHGLHATRTGEWLQREHLPAHLPVVLTLTGTDVNGDLRAPAPAPATLAALERAAAIVAFHDLDLPHLLRQPPLAPRLRVIPQSVDLAPSLTAHLDRPALLARFGLTGFMPADAVVFLLVAGIRPVKQAGFALGPLAELYAADPRIRFLLAGPVLDAEAGQQVLGRLRACPFARYLGVVEPDEIPLLNALADICLNTSDSEGMPQAVLEAMAAARPVLCSRIPGNQALVDETVGCLYADPAEFAQSATRLAADADLRARLGAAGRRRVLTRFAPQAEASAYLALYRSLLSAN